MGKLAESGEWIRRLAEGDTSVLEEIYDAGAERLFGHALWVTRNPQDAEDIVQDVIVRLAGMGSDAGTIRNLEGYLFQMTHRAALQLLRSRASRARQAVDPALFIVDGNDALRQAQIAQAERLLGGLGPEQREAVYLHLYEGLTFREIGRVAGVSTFTAASRYRLAMRRLRKGTS